MSVVGPGSWRDCALREIARIHKEMPNATADELRKALRKASGSFTGGTSWGGKIWPSACRQYLVAHFGQPAAVKQRTVEDSPLFNAADIAFPFRP